MAWFNQIESLKHKLEPFHVNASDPYIYQETMNLKSFNDCIHSIYISRPAPWMPHNIGLLYMNIPYGMPQLQHYSSGWQTLNHISLGMP